MFRGKYTQTHSHFYMLSDTHRVDGFIKAIRGKVCVGDIVVDLGAGTGILGIECAKAGADTVHLVEQEPKLIPVIEAMIKEHGVEEQCVIHNKRSDEFIKEFEGQVDLIVCEGIGDHIFESRLIKDFLEFKDKHNIDSIPEYFELHVHHTPVKINRELLGKYHTVLDKLEKPTLDSVNITNNTIHDRLYKFGDKITESKCILGFDSPGQLRKHCEKISLNRIPDDDEYLILYFEIDLWNKINISNKLTREDLPHSYYQRLISCKDIKSPNIQIKIDYEKHITGIEDEPFPNIEIVNV